MWVFTYPPLEGDQSYIVDLLPKHPPEVLIFERHLFGNPQRNYWAFLPPRIPHGAGRSIQPHWGRHSLEKD